jgi:hypothetical protein
MVSYLVCMHHFIRHSDANSTLPVIIRLAFVFGTPCVVIYLLCAYYLLNRDVKAVHEYEDGAGLKYMHDLSGVNLTSCLIYVIVNLFLICLILSTKY